jgi:membrane protease YdiL (CAAX protease family)
MSTSRPSSPAPPAAITLQAVIVARLRGGAKIAVIADLNDIGLWFIAMVPITAIFEEIVFRGFMYRGLSKQDTESFLAIVVTAFVFALVHVDSFVIWHFIWAVLYGFLRWRTGTIWSPIAAHTFYNCLAFTFSSLVRVG